jgi:hypothetical protein
VPTYLLINETEPRWRLDDGIDPTELRKTLTNAMEEGKATY